MRAVLLIWGLLLGPLLWAQGPQNGSEEFTRLKETLLKDNDPVRKGSAASHILRLETSEGMEFLRGILREPTDPAVVDVVLKAFSVAGNYSALEEMLILVSDDREVIRKAALASFKSMPDGGGRLSADILRVISSSTSRESVRRAAIVTAGELGMLDAIEGISSYLDSEKYSKAAKDAIHKISGFWFSEKTAFETWWATHKTWTREKILEEALQSSEKRQIELRLAWMKDDLDRHLAGLSDPFPEIRKAAAQGIPNFRTDVAIAKAVDPLCQQLKFEYDQEAREAMLMALGAIGAGNIQARDIVMKAIDSPVARERRIAIRSLENFASDPTVLALFASIVRDWVDGRRSDEVDFRLDLLLALHRAGEPKGSSFDLSLQLGKLMLNDPVDEVRKRAALALGVYGDLESINQLALAINPSKEKAPNVRFNAANALRQIGGRLQNFSAVLPQLHAFLKDPAYQNRKQGVDLLGEIRDQSSSEVLMTMLNVESERDLRRGIWTAIGKIGNLAALDNLIKMDLRDGDDRESYFAAVDTLAGKDPSRLLKTATEMLNRNEYRWTVFLLDRALSLEGLDPNYRVQAEKVIVPAYRAVAREMMSRPNAAPTAGNDFLVKAKLRLNHLREAEPEQITWMIYLAEVLFDLGQKDEAIASYADLAPRAEKAAANDPHMLRRALEPYANLLIEKRDFKSAEPLLLRLVSVLDKDRSIREKLAKLEISLDSPAEAIASYQILRQITPVEDKEEYWRVTADLASLRVEHSNADGVFELLQGYPAAGVISSDLHTRLAEIERKAREIYDFVGPLMDPRVPFVSEKKN